MGKGASMKSSAVYMTDFKSLTLKGRGKVRDIYDFGDRLLIVATDRVSAFDVVMPIPIPDKGRILTQLSKFWFALTKEIVPNHVISTNVKDFPLDCQPYGEMLRLCSKPSPYFIRQAEKDYGINLKSSYVIGDHPHDIEMGQAVGAGAIYVLTGHGREHKEKLSIEPNFVCSNLYEGAIWIMESLLCNKKGG